MRLLYLQNDPGEPYQKGSRATLDHMISTGVLDGYQAFPFLLVEKQLMSWEKTLQKLYEKVVEYKPELILFTHTAFHEFPKTFIEKIKSSDQTPPVIGYDERDVYGYVTKRLPLAVVNLARQSDVVFLVSAGRFSDRFRDRGCTNVCFLPSVASTYQFGSPWTPTYERQYDVLMIANHSPSRTHLDFMSMPGVSRRYELVAKLSKEFKDRFAIFGRGWEEIPGNKGPIPFDAQDKINRSSWITIGYNLYPDYEFYYSDRLPIAMLSGVAHVTHRSRGLENLFIDKEHCVFFESVDDAVQKCKQLLEWPKDELIQLGDRGAAWVREHFTEDIRMGLMIEKMKKIYQIRSRMSFLSQIESK